MLKKEDLINQSDQSLSNSPKKPKRLTIILVSVLLLTTVGVGGYMLGARRQQSPPRDLLTNPESNRFLTVTPVQQPSATSIADWTTYKHDTCSISFPSTWATDSRLGLRLKSADFTPIKYAGENHPETGFIVDLHIGRQQFSSDNPLGLVSTRYTTWLGAKALLQVYRYEGNFLVLTAKRKGIAYQMVMSAATDDVRNINEAIFLKVANTLKCK